MSNTPPFVTSTVTGNALSRLRLTFIMIPTEIVDHILSSLHSDQDYISLKSCSVVFPLLVDRHLYSQITFYISGGTILHSESYFQPDDTYVVDPTIFFHTMFDNPHVLDCVRSVRIVLVVMRTLVPRHFEVISAILPFLTHIESLTLTAIGRLYVNQSSRTYWPTLGPLFSTVFENCLRLPSLKKAAISEFDGFPLNIFKDCKSLTSLRLHELGFVDGGDTSTSPYPRLSSLHVGGQLSDWTRITSWSSTLHDLSLCTRTRFDFPVSRNLIAACSASLVNLELNCEIYFGGWRKFLRWNEKLIDNDNDDIQTPTRSHI